MRTQASLALTPRELRRNRIMLAACATALVVSTGVAAVLLSRTSQPGPLLLAIDEMPVQHVVERTPAVSAFPKSMIEEPAAVSAVLESAPSQPVATLEPANHDANIRWFNGRPIRPVRTMNMLVTAYSPDARSCGESADGITASGYSVWTNGMKMVAADTDLLPFGSMISIPGYDDGNVVPVLDRGGAIKGHRLDVLYPTHEQACEWGAQRLQITVWEYADGKPNDFATRYH